MNAVIDRIDNSFRIAELEDRAAQQTLAMATSLISLIDLRDRYTGGHSSRVASYCRAEHGDAQLFGQSRTLRVKQLLGLTGSMANLDLAAPSAAILPKLRFSCSFAGLQAQLQPVAEIVPNT